MPSERILALMALLVGLSLRPTMAAIGPLLEQLQSQAGLSSTQAGLLTTLPVALMGVFALLGSTRIGRLGEARAIALALATLMLASAGRAVWPTPAGLIASAALGGVGIALAQVAMPGLLKRLAPARAGALLGLFSTGIMAGAALAASTAAPLSALVGWQATLAMAALPALITLYLWWRLCGAIEPAMQASRSVKWRDGMSNRRLVFFGLGTAAYTLVLAWLPPWFVQLGWSPRQAGYLLGALTFVEVLAGLAVSAAATHWPDRRALLYGALLALASGLLALAMAPLALAWAAMVLLGTGIGALFPLSLIVTLDRADSPAHAQALLGRVQGGGYLIAACAPLAAGALRDAVTSLQGAWWAMLLFVLVLLALVPSLGPRDCAQQTACTG